jgi:TIR domain-containing protein
VTLRRTRLFVSHSSPAPGQVERLKAFVGSLTSGEDAVEVLYDAQHISAGQLWRQRINAMLAECDAAVILLSPEALASPWVLKETAILSWRAARDARFPLLPLAWPGVSRTALRDSALWRPLNLTDIQFLDVDEPVAAATEVKALLAPLRHLGGQAPLDVLAGDISELLARAPQERCAVFWSHLDEPWPPGALAQKRVLARAIARWMLCQQPPALERVARALMHLGEVFPIEDSHKIIELIAPLWVELDAAAWFAAGRLDQGGVRDLAIRCRRPGQVLDHYMRMAHLPARSPRVFLLNGITAGPHVEEVATELRNVLGPLLERAAGRKLTDFEIDDKLGRLKERPCVALPMPDDRSVIEELRQRFSRVFFVYFAADDGEAQNVQWVVPQLDTEVEEAVCEDLEEAKFVLSTRGRAW